MSEKYSEISSFIWTVCDDLLRGLFKGHEYGDVILPFVVLRRLDCVLEPSKDKVIELYGKYSKMVDDPKTKGFISQVFYEGLKQLYSQNPPSGM